MVGLLRQLKDLYIGPPPGKGVIQDLEYAMRTKRTTFGSEDMLTKFHCAGNKLLGYPHGPHTSGLRRFCAAIGCAYLMGEGFYRVILHTCPVVVLDTDKGRMKMELANIILTKHSDDLFLVDAVKRNFFAEHLFDDLHQDQPLFRWHPRRSYTDGAFVEGMKEIEATNSDDDARSVSRATTANNRPLGDLMEDPLACILGSPGDDVESNNPAGNTSTVLKRSELRARRRSHRHHHYRQADDKFAAL